MNRNETLKLARNWLGKNIHDGSHKEIIDIYNSQKPLPRGYAVKYTDDWCAAFVSALAVKLGGVGNVIPTECSAPKMMDMFADRGRLSAAAGYVPEPGDICFFDWNKDGGANHVAIVDEVKNGCVITIDGNYHNYKVGYRTTELTDGRLLAYGHPAYGDAEIPKPTPVPAYTREDFVRDVQNVTGSRVDGVAGNQTLENTPTLSSTKNQHHMAVLPVQKRLASLGYAVGPKGDSRDFDGVTGTWFSEAVKAFQRDQGLMRNPDGELTGGHNSWKRLLEV